jgi:hypothetical protein
MVSNVKQVVDAELEGRARQYDYIKNVGNLISSDCYFDMSMSSGNPRAKYWFDAPPGIAAAISQSDDGGLFHGANVSPYTKYLVSLSAQALGAATVPCNAILSDYLLYYPSIDESNVGETILDNTVTLPRYTDGEGVMILPVVVAAAVGGGQMYVTYTNSDGVSGRVSRTIYVTNGANGCVLGLPFGGIIPDTTAPFVGLQDGDTGVRSIESVTVTVGDGGLVSFLLVKPLANISLKELSAPHEKNLLMAGAGLPVIEDDAYLNFVTTFGTAFPAGFRGDIKVIWN